MDVNNPDWNQVVFRAKPTYHNHVPTIKASHNNQSIHVNAAAIERRLEEDKLSTPKPVPREFRIEMAQARQNNKMTQKQLATTCNLPESSIKSFENGTSRPTGQDLAKINRALGTKLKLNK